MELATDKSWFSHTKTHLCNNNRIPLNDDAGEKVARFQSRQALHDLQMNQIKAAVKTPMPPMRKINSYERASSSSPRTPRGSSVRVGGRETDSGGRQIVNGRAVTPMKRVPILANFEEWMKMATDNKINAANSWNFALIDYFHDMSLLKEGDGVNFQKASCTLDGCVKIYTSRVDSVATETGKLLSGLADSNNKKRQQDEGEGGEGDDDEEDETGEDGVKRKKQRKVGVAFLFSKSLTIFGSLTCFVPDTIARKYLGAVVLLTSIEEVRIRIFRRPSIQKSFCGFRRGWRKGTSSEPPFN